MEKEELLQMVKLYKNKLADAEEKNIIYEVIIAKQSKENKSLSQTIEQLEAELIVSKHENATV